MSYYDIIKLERGQIVIVPLCERCLSCVWFRDIGIGYCVLNTSYHDPDECPSYKERGDKFESAVPRL